MLRGSLHLKAKGMCQQFRMYVFFSREASCGPFDDNAMNPGNMSQSRGLAFSTWQRGVGSISPNVHNWLVSRSMCSRFRDARSNTSGDSCFVNFVICFGEMSMFSGRQLSSIASPQNSGVEGLPLPFLLSTLFDSEVEHMNTRCRLLAN